MLVSNRDCREFRKWLKRWFFIASVWNEKEEWEQIKIVRKRLSFWYAFKKVSWRFFFLFLQNHPKFTGDFFFRFVESKTKKKYYNKFNAIQWSASLKRYIWQKQIFINNLCMFDEKANEKFCLSANFNSFLRYLPN